MSNDLRVSKFQSDQTPERQHEFVLAEYNRLCSEIEHYSKESSACVTYAIASSAAVWAWIGTNTQWSSKLVIWLPVALNLFLGIRWFCLQKASGVIGNYLKETEFLYFNGTHGWESKVQTGDAGARQKLWHLGAWGLAFFLGLLAISAFAACIMKPSEENQVTQKARDVVKAIDKLSKAQEALKKQLTNPPSNGSLNASPSPPAKTAASSTTPTSEPPKP